MPVINKGTKKRWLKIFKRRRRDAVELGQHADEQVEKLLIRRLSHLASVRRFVFLWLSLFILIFVCTVLQIRGLSPYYQTLQPVAGGLYNEGLVGSFTNANPLYATGTADAAVTHLIFSGLFRYDDNNNLVGDLADNLSINASQTQYSVHLNHNIKWQDGAPFSADDVVFTYQTIQNPAAQSPIYNSWQGITVTKLDQYTVNFTLPNALSSFPYALVNGIVPAHLLKSIDPEQLRSASFNTNPVGTGPFIWKYVEVTGTNATNRQQRISLAAYDKYWAGRPKLDGFSLLTFSDDQRLIDAFKNKQLNAISGLQEVPDSLAGDKSIQVISTPQNSAVMAFFNNSHSPLNDAAVRKGLISSVDRKALIASFKYPTFPVDGPLLRGQLGYDASLVEPGYDINAARQALDSDGWTIGTAGLRYKNGQPLTFSMVTQDTPQYTRVAQYLQKVWAKLGVKVTVKYFSATDLQTEAIASHGYDVLLYGINIGVDPDVFAYWDSSQASVSSQGHLNLSEYKSAVADQALEAARTRADAPTRIVKYKAFLGAWTQDSPALALYQPDLLYITRGPVFGYQRKAGNSDISRFYNVNQWQIRQQRKNIN